LLGEEYGPSIAAIRWLAIVPFLQSLHYFAANTLTGAGYQGLRSAVQIGVAVVNVLLNLLWIPVYSWKGAAWATLTCEALLTIALWGSIVFRTKPWRTSFRET
jgi:O-antigen/teichoic acid export membrane protein